MHLFIYLFFRLFLSYKCKLCKLFIGYHLNKYNPKLMLKYYIDEEWKWLKVYFCFVLFIYLGFNLYIKK